MSQDGHPTGAGGPLRVDLGCGGAKRAGFVGVDYIAALGVDHVVDLTEQPLPFADASVDQVFSAHFLEHVKKPKNVLREIGRVCRDGAGIEFWTPYAFSDEAFVYGHEVFLTEKPWRHFCIEHRDTHLPILGGRWLLHRIVYVVLPHVEAELAARGFDLDFAIRYFKGVVVEFGVEIEFRRDLAVPPVEPERLVASSRDGERRRLAA